MEIRKGIPVSPGVVIGPAIVLEAEDVRIPHRHVVAEQVDAEIGRLEKAFQESRRQMLAERDAAARRLGEETAAIFDFHERLLGDSRFVQRIADNIRENNHSAPYAVSEVMRHYQQSFLQMKDAYLAGRVADIRDIERRVLRHLLGGQREDLAHLRSPVVVIASDLTPSQTAALDTDRIMGFATDAGGRTSHTAIIARSLGIPAVVGLEDVSTAVSGGDAVIIDGTHGVVITNPDAAARERYEAERRKMTALASELVELRDLPAQTRDGTAVTLLANIEFPHEVTGALQRGAQGIGLYRTEFLYLRGPAPPSEEEHYQAYCEAIEAAGDHPIVIRSLDLGADKFTDAMAQAPERNPFLGLRSIRYCLRHLDIFQPQLRAILRAALKGPQVKLMFPLITSVMELRQAKMILADVVEELHEEDRPFRRELPVGVMIETPAAADIAPALAREVDFFSIGTNDLVQYMLAVDRGNERVAQMYTPAHPAILRKVRDILKAATRGKIACSLCGEMAGEPMFALLLLGLGLRQFSMAPAEIPVIKKIIRSTTLKSAQRIARKVLTFENDRQVVNCLRDETRKILPEEV